MSTWSIGDLLPAVWLLVVGFLVDRAARRWARPIPPVAWLTAGAVVLALFGPALLLGRVLASLQNLGAFPPFGDLRAAGGAGNPLHGDLLLQVIPWDAAVRRFLAAGEWPLWNPWSGAGTPLLGNPASQVLQPLVWLTLPLPLAASLGVLAALRVLVALLSTHLLLREQGAGRAASLFGAVAYGICGFVVLYVGWPLANAAALLPLAVYATARWMRRRERTGWVVLAVAMAAVLASGHPDTVLWVLVASGLFTLAGGSGGWRRWGRGAVGWGVAVVVAAALVAPAGLPALGEVTRSQRFAMTEGRGARLAAARTELARGGLGALGAELAVSGRRLLPVAAPNAFGNQRFGPYWGEERNVNAGSGGFAGSAALLAALVAGVCLLSRRGAVLPGERPAAVLLVVSAILASRIPGAVDLIAAVPGMEHSANFDRRAPMVLAFAVAFLAAAAVERWRRGLLRPAPVLALAAGLAALVTWGYLTHPDPRTPGALAHLRYGSLALHLAVLGVAAALLASRRLATSRRAAVALVGVQALELLVLHAPANPTAPAASFYPSTPALTYLREHSAEDRIVGLDPVLRANVATVYGLADVRTNDPSKPWEVHGLLAPVMPPGPRGRFGIADQVVVPDHPVLDLLGVRFVLADARLQAPPPLTPVFAGPSVAVWRRPHPLERFFLPAEAEALRTAASEGGRTGDWQRWTARNPDFSARSLVEPTPGHPQRWRAERPSGSALRVTRTAADRWHGRALLAEERLLASGLYQDGGWRLLVDGGRAPTVRTNGPLLGAWVAAGEHDLDLVYRPPGFVLGCLLAALALTVLFVVGARRPSGIAVEAAAAGAKAARLKECR